jgi:hypothetical protein
VSLVLDGRAIETPGLETVSFLDDSRVPHATDYNDRAKPIVAVLLHTVKGKSGPLLPGSKPSTRDLTYAAYQARTDREVSWDYTVDTDGSIAVSNDPVRRYTWHAGAGEVNRQSVGIEAVQYDDGAQYEAEIAAEVALVELLCERLHIPRRTPVTADGRPFGGLLDERLFQGVYGHRNLWKMKDGRRVTMKPLGDPDDHVFRALLRAGFQGVPVDRRGCITAPTAPPPPPSWIDLTQEVTDTSDRVIAPEAFAWESMSALQAIGLDRARAAEVTAHCATECSWGRRAIAQNRGGVKLKQRDDTAHRQQHGRGLGWWRAQGHVVAGDDAWVYYRAFADAGEFWRFWVARYVPRDAEPDERYAATGAAFWGADPARWFGELLRAGYRGPVRQQEIEDLLDRGADPEAHPSVREHRSVVERVRADAGS